MMKLFFRQQLSAFVRGELNLRQRRRLLRQIDQSPQAYQQYQHWYRFEDNLKADMPCIGQPQKQDLNRIWTQIQAELNPQSDFPRRRYIGLRYGFGVLAISMMIMIPFAIGNGNGERRVVTPPTPVTIIARAATASSENVVAVATQGPTSPGDQDVTFIPQAAKTPEAG